MSELEFTVENLELIKNKYYISYDEGKVLDVMISIAANNEKLDCLSESNVCSREFLLNVINKAFECNVRASLRTLLELVYSEYETPNLLAVKMKGIVRAITEIKDGYSSSEYLSLNEEKNVFSKQPIFRMLDENEIEKIAVEADRVEVKTHQEDRKYLKEELDF